MSTEQYKEIEKLHHMFIRCPRHWQNFISSFPYDACRDAEGVTAQEINRELKKYKARFIETKTQGSYIRYDDKHLQLMFVLRWS